MGSRPRERHRSGELPEPDREQGRAQRVLERLPGAEVGREREGAYHLGRPDRPLSGTRPRGSWSGILLHVETLVTLERMSREGPSAAA